MAGAGFQRIVAEGRAWHEHQMAMADEGPPARPGRILLDIPLGVPEGCLKDGRRRSAAPRWSRS